MNTKSTQPNTAPTTETVADRIARLGLTDIVHTEALEAAHPLVDDAAFARISDALRVSQDTTIDLPPHALEMKARGSGWCRRGRGEQAVWGERTAKGYRVGPGRWTIGGSDGVSRKGTVEWVVEHITVGDEIWTIAI